MRQPVFWQIDGQEPVCSSVQAVPERFPDPDLEVQIAVLQRRQRILLRSCQHIGLAGCQRVQLGGGQRCKVGRGQGGNLRDGQRRDLVRRQRRDAGRRLFGEPLGRLLRDWCNRGHLRAR